MYQFLSRFWKFYVKDIYFSKNQTPQERALGFWSFFVVVFIPLGLFATLVKVMYYICLFLM